MYTPVVSEFDSARADEVDVTIATIIPFADVDEVVNAHRHQPFVYGVIAVDVAPELLPTAPLAK